MYLPRSLISTLYLHLQKTQHSLSPPVLILVALDPDALCACRILTQLLKHDYIPHKIQPVAGYGDLEKAGKNVVQPMMESNGGAGGVVVCLGVGGLVDLGGLLGLDSDEEQINYGGVEVWVIDARRPWNLGNVFGGHSLPAQVEGGEESMSKQQTGIDGGKVLRSYKPGKGGIVVFDDGDIEEDLAAERDAYLALVDMPEVEDDGEDLDGSDTDDENDDEITSANPIPGQKRKSWTDRDSNDESSDDEDRPRQRRRSNSVCFLVPFILYILTFDTVESNFRFADAAEATWFALTQWPGTFDFERGLQIRHPYPWPTSQDAFGANIAAAPSENAATT